MQMYFQENIIYLFILHFRLTEYLKAVYMAYANTMMQILKSQAVLNKINQNQLYPS